MIELGPATADDMVLAFLRAEIDSSRLGHVYAGILRNSQLDRHSIIDKPNLEDANGRRIRNEMLRAVRGFSENKLLFEGFPTGASWRRVRLENADVATLKYANYPLWLELSDNTRLVTRGAAKVESGQQLSQLGEQTRVNVQAVVAAYRNGKRYAELITVEGRDGHPIVFEGHTRATAYVVAGLPEPIDALIASSPRMQEWAFY